MANRLKLDDEFRKLTKYVYFQPPASVDLKYPCIIYHRDRNINYFADNKKYLSYQGYQVQVIDKDPDSKIVQKLIECPSDDLNIKYCVHANHYSQNNLNYDIFSVFI